MNRSVKAYNEGEMQSADDFFVGNSIPDQYRIVRNCDFVYERWLISKI